MKLMMFLMFPFFIVLSYTKGLDVIHPEDEENLGYLKVVAPNLSGQKQIPVSLNIDDKFQVNLDQTSYEMRLLGGLHPLSLYTSFYSAEKKDVQVIKKESVTYRLASIAPHFDGNIFEVSFGPRAKLAVTLGDSIYDWNGGSTQEAAFIGDFLSSDFWSGRSKFYHPILPMKHNFVFYPPVIGTYSKNFEVGEIRDLDLNIGEKRTTLRVLTPKRYFPDPYPDFSLRNHLISSVVRHAVETSSELGFTVDGEQMRLVGESNNRIMQMPKDETVYEFKGYSLKGTELRSPPNSNDFLVTSYMMTINGTTKSFYSFQPDEVVNQKIKRIDVDDVKVTKEDGSFYYAKGLYSIQRLDQAETVCLSYYSDHKYSCYYSEFPTRTGLDVLPGKYKIKIKYSTLENTAEVQEFSLDLT